MAVGTKIDNKSIIDNLRECLSGDNSLGKKLASCPLYTTDIEFKIYTDDDDKILPFVFSSSSPEEDTENNHLGNYFMSMRNIKGSNGACNQFEIMIAYAPTPYMAMEKAYTTNIGKSPDENRATDYSSINRIDAILSQHKYCTLKYGYGNTDWNLTSPTYKGSIIDYSMQFDNGFLMYTIKGYSYIAVTSEKKIASAPISEPTSEVENPIEDSSPTISNEGSEGNESTGTEESSSTSTTYLYNPIKEFEAVVKKYLSTDALNNTNNGYKFRSNIDEYSEVVDVPINNYTDTGIHEYLMTLTNLMQNRKEQEEGNDKATKDKITYQFIINDAISSGNKTIDLIRVNPKEEENEVSFSFDLSSKENNLVLNFQPSYKGATLMSLSYIQDNDFKENKRVAIDENGDYVETDGVQAAPSAMSYKGDKSDEIIDKNQWSKALIGSMATMTLVGIPYEIPLLTKFDIHPLIWGQEHISGGTYRVTKVTDIITSNGFETQLEMSKLDHNSKKIIEVN